MRNEVIFDSRGIPDTMVVFTPDELGLLPQSVFPRGRVPFLRLWCASAAHSSLVRRCQPGPLASQIRILDDLAEHYEAVAENWEEIKERYVYGD